MGEAARKLEPSSEHSATLAALMALPLRDEPMTDQERAIFEEAEADMRAGRRGVTTEQILATLDEMSRTEE
jgi:hypothetical protein